MVDKKCVFPIMADKKICLFLGNPYYYIKNYQEKVLKRADITTFSQINVDSFINNLNYECTK